MKIAQFNTFDVHGGAANASHRLYMGLKNTNQNITYFVKNKKSKDKNIISLSLDTKYNKINNYLQTSYINSNRTAISNTYFTITLNNTILPNLNKFDIINIHWIEEFLSLDNLYEILKLNIPIVWTFHDMKPFTGGCHYNSDCEGFANLCLACNQLNQDSLQLPNKILMLKKEILENANITVITPSKWLAKEVKKSTLFKNKKIKVIANSIDSNVFLPTNKLMAKKYFNIPSDKIVLAFGVQDHSEKRKGFLEILSAINQIKNQLINNNVLVLFFGKSTSVELPINSINLGHIEDDNKMSLVYSATDIFILPSLEDNLPNAILESLSCETPIISFDTGGARDIISEKNGIIIEKGNIKLLSTAILDLVTNPKERIKKGKEGRKLILKKYQLNTQAKKYLKLYNSIINKQQDKYINEVNFQSFYESLENYCQNFLLENKSLLFSRNYTKFYNLIQNLKQKNEKYILYGNGTIGKTIKKLMPEKVIVFVDQTSKNISKEIIPGEVYNPKNLSQMKYDKIIISVLGREEEIISYLVNDLNINQNKIITIRI